ncbi:MAG: protein TolR [Deltaproteobacteria bacterium]|nr:protein TolR [Deltaproteobacteria bacterium]MBI2500810.1 protein TolR [Deltaproteobacteria bacterium]MBI4196609.1 protein TolR [Deltaproteobacteria bacterium]
MGIHNSDKGKPLSEINVTPFVDVMLVLLIIFMITAPLISQGLDVDLPETAAPNMKRSESDVIITIDKEGKIFLLDDKTAYSLDNIEEKLQAVFKRRERKEILLQADRKTAYGIVVKAIALFKKAGVERVGMMTEEEKEKT